MGMAKAQPVACLIVGSGSFQMFVLCALREFIQMVQPAGQEPGSLNSAKKEGEFTVLPAMQELSLCLRERKTFLPTSHPLLCSVWKQVVAKKTKESYIDLH